MRYVSRQLSRIVRANHWSVGGVLCLAVIGLLISGRYSSPHTAVNGQAATMSFFGEPTVRFLALGDSYTIGEGVDESDRWPVQLVARLRQDSLNLADPDIIARRGWTTDELQRAINADKRGPYDLVSLQIGVNNQYRGRSLENYRMEFRQLLQTAILLANGRAGRVFVLSIPDWGQSPAANGQGRATISLAIDQFNAVARSECQQAGVAFVDLTPLTRRAAGNDSRFVGDGLHYSGQHMAQWVEAVRPVVRLGIRD